MCNECDILKNKIDALQNLLGKFTNGRDKFNISLGNQKVSYNKVDLVYEPKNNSKRIINIFNSQSTFKCKILKCNYYNKLDHIAMFGFNKKSHERKQGYPPSHIYKEHCERKKRKMYTHNMYPLTSKDPKRFGYQRPKSQIVIKMCLTT